MLLGLASRGVAFEFVAMLAAIGMVSIATPFLNVQRWFAWPNIILTAPVPVALAGISILLLRSLTKKYDYQPFFLSLTLFALSYAGLGISIYPYIVPQSLTIWQAASPEKSQLFMVAWRRRADTSDSRLHGWAYWVFHGKVNAASGFH